MLQTEFDALYFSCLKSPYQAGSDDVYLNWPLISKITSHDNYYSQTIWHIMAGWTDMDWLHFEIGCKLACKGTFQMERWLISIYTINDENIPNNHGFTAQDISLKNQSFNGLNILSSWWAHRRNELERHQLFAMSPLDFSNPAIATAL
jgi:hypothetical protein